MVEIKSILNSIGNWITNFAHTVLSNTTSAKILSILLFLLICFIAIKFLNKVSPLIKWAIVILSILLLISVGSTFIS